jgi:polyhydroxyalkanoate synthase
MSKRSVKRGQARRALQTAWDISWLGDGLEAYSPTPSDVVYDEPHAQLRQVLPDGAPTGTPVLLVTPLAVSASCWDLRPGQSMAAHLGAQRPTYVIDYGDMTFADRAMGFEDFFADIIPTAVRRISDRHGGSPVHLVGWSLGGTISLLTASYDPALPIASVVALGTPVDYGLNASAKPLVWLDGLVGTPALTRSVAFLGGIPAPLVQTVFRATAPVREITKPWYLLRTLNDREALARTEAIARFIGSMPGYPGRLYNQMHARLIVRRELATGVVHFGNGRDVHLDRLNVPLLLVGSATDAIASSAAVEAGIRVFTGSPDVSYQPADGLSHLGLIADTKARGTSWALTDEFLATHDR